MIDARKSDPLNDAYEIAKAHASVDGAFPELLMRHWFDAAWELCALMIDFTYPAQQSSEKMMQRDDGTIWLLHTPSSDVKLYAGPNLVAVLPPNSPCLGGSPGYQRRRAGDAAVYGPYREDHCGAPCPDLCCYCGDVTAVYTYGSDTCTVSPRFVQAVARLFAYICENRGDVELDDQVLKKCGAFRFLGPDLTYAL